MRNNCSDGVAGSGLKEQEYWFSEFQILHRYFETTVCHWCPKGRHYW